MVVGQVLRPHGIRGEVKVQPLSDVSGRFEAGKPLWIQTRDGGFHEVRIQGVRPGMGHLLVALEGYTQREAVKSFTGARILVPESHVPPPEEGVYYHFQLVGMAVYDEEGTYLGRLEEILVTGSNDVFVVRDQRQEWLIPALREVCVEVDVARKRMRVRRLEYL